MLMAIMLSHLSGITVWLMQMSLSCCDIHSSCGQHALALIYSISTVDRATEFCFLEWQYIVIVSYIINIKVPYQSKGVSFCRPESLTSI